MSMKHYTIHYNHSTGCRDKSTTSITQLFEWLEAALQDEHVIDGSIILTTEKREDEK